MCVVSVSLWSVTLAERVKVDGQVCVWVCVGSGQGSLSPNRCNSPSSQSSLQALWQQGQRGPRGHWGSGDRKRWATQRSLSDSSTHAFSSLQRLQEMVGKAQFSSLCWRISYWNRKSGGTRPFILDFVFYSLPLMCIHKWEIVQKYKYQSCTFCNEGKWSKLYYEMAWNTGFF